MNFFGYHVKFSLGFTVFEVQLGKFYCRFLRPRMYFWPYRLFPSTPLRWPNAISVGTYKDPRKYLVSWTSTPVKR